VQVLDSHTLRYPEYRGNGVMGSLGNIATNPQVGLLLVDFDEQLIGLHVNGRARIVELGEANGQAPPAEGDGPRPERYVQVQVAEAYIHCRKHLPRMVPVPRNRQWGTDEAAPKGGDYFGVAAQRRTGRDPLDA
jgi:predicted pyridoxine 5'-phosphate oxidase superfamily flavin-nucleotide-binding protein